MEKRKHRRIPFDRVVNVSSDRGQDYTLSAYDFSLNGMGLYSDTPPVIGDILKLRFQITPMGQPRELDVEGEVKHINFTDQGYMLGVNFLD